MKITDFSLLLLALLALVVGCTPAPAINLSEPVGGQICTTVKYLEDMKVEAYQAGIKAGSKADVSLYYPTYAELVEWLKTEPTQRCVTENCAQRLSDFSNCARAQRYDMWVVLMIATDGDGHVIAAFPTKDKGVMFVDPTSNTIVLEPKEGQDYSTNFPEASRKIIKEVNIAK